MKATGIIRTLIILNMLLLPFIATKVKQTGKKHIREESISRKRVLGEDDEAEKEPEQYYDSCFEHEELGTDTL